MGRLVNICVLFFWTKKNILSSMVLDISWTMLCSFHPGSPCHIHLQCICLSGLTLLWNAMIHPLLNMTIKGAIWYQGKTAWRHICQHTVTAQKLKTCLTSDLTPVIGEANTDYNQKKYSCSFPSMIDDWRMAFHQSSGGQTAPDFPFGFVQVLTKC